MNNERRSEPRFAIDTGVLLSIKGRAAIKAEGINISSNGILVESYKSIEPGTRLMLNLELPAENGEGIEITCEGTVVRVIEMPQTLRIAIYFSDIRKRDKEQLESFIDTVLSNHI